MSGQREGGSEARIARAARTFANARGEAVFVCESKFEEIVPLIVFSSELEPGDKIMAGYLPEVAQ